MLRLTLTALLPLVSLGTVAMAQGENNQTPEGAQRFMAGVLPDTDIVDNRLSDISLPPEIETILRNYFKNDSSGYTFDEYIKSMNHLTRTSRIKIFRQGGDVCTSYTDIFSEGYALNSLKLVYREAQSTTITLDWSKVVSARSAGKKAFVLTRQPGVPLSSLHKAIGTREIEFRLPDEGLAARVAYAAEFLRLSCDPLADTGF